METLAQDARYAIRQLIRMPGFTLVCVATLTLAIGANTAAFSVMNAILLRYLPVPNPQQLVYLHLENQPLGTTQNGYSDTSFSLPVYEQMRGQRQAFSELMALAPLAVQKTTVRVDLEPEQAYGEMVSGNFFSGLGVQLLLGRGFTSKDEQDHSPVVVLSYEWWTRRFAQDRNVLGKVLSIKGVPFTITGVAPRVFFGADPDHAMDFWIPLQGRSDLNPWGGASSSQTLYGSPNWLCLLLIGRLQPGVSKDLAASALTPLLQRTLYAGVQGNDPGEPQPRLYFSSVRGIEDLQADYQYPLNFLMGMVLVVLVIACSNVAMLLSVRNLNRRRDFVLRVALGASRSRILRQLLTEGALLAGIGAAAGWVFSNWATKILTRWSGLEVTVAPDRNVLIFTLLISLAAALAFGLLPVRGATTVSLSEAAKTTKGASNTTPAQRFSQSLIVGAQILFCLVLLVAAGLLSSTLRNLQNQDLGVRADELLVFGLEPGKDVHSDADAIRFHQAMLGRIRSLPGVESATVIENRLGAGTSGNDGVLVDKQNPLPGERFAPMRTNSVGEKFLHVLGIPLVLGRDLEESDDQSSQKVVVINETFARRYLPDTNPLGHHISFLTGKSQWEIVGVARNSRYTGLHEEDHPTAYFPYKQLSEISEMQYEVRTISAPSVLVPTITQAVHALDPDLPLKKPITQKAEFDESISRERLTGNLAVFFGILSVLLVATGLYGTLSHSVSRRRVDIGVRMAMGARRGDILWMITRESLTVSGIAIVLALPVAGLVAYVMRSMLYGIGPMDLPVFLMALGGVVILTLGASCIPAYQAASTNPSQALRSE